MKGTTFYLRKASDTHADGLAVAGLAYLLSRIGTEQPRSVNIRDRNAFYEVVVAPSVSEQDVATWNGDGFYPYIKLKGDKAAPPQAFDYEAESKLLLDARKLKQSKTGARKRTAVIIDRENSSLNEAAAAPNAETALLRIFNGMRKGFKGDIEFHRALLANPPREELTRRLIQLEQVAREETSETPFELKISASQWFLPLAGKGVSRVKADSASPAQFSESRLDWFESWLRYIGMYRAMTSHGVGDDLKVIVIAPSNLEAELLPKMRAALRDANIFGGRIDVRAPLELARALVQNSEEYRGPQPGERILRCASRAPRQIISGLYVTTYKKMGTASSVMGIAFLGIPNWSQIRDRSSAEDFLATLDDLDAYQEILRDNISEDIETLRTMRDFLSAGTLELALDFFARVAFDVMKRLGGKKYARLLSTNTARRVLMGLSTDAPLTTTIIENQGFQNMAKAVRAATIHAQLHSDSVLQPRYGLAQAWRQQARFKERFVEALAGFVQQFNADVTRQREVDTKKGNKREYYPALLTTDDLHAVLQLIEAKGSSSHLVANLLLAFGFAQVSKKEESLKTTSNQPEVKS